MGGRIWPQPGVYPPWGRAGPGSSPGGAVSTLCRRTRARGCGAGARLILRCLSHAPCSDPPRGGEPPAPLPLGLVGKGIINLSTALPPLSPEPPPPPPVPCYGGQDGARQWQCLPHLPLDSMGFLARKVVFFSSPPPPSSALAGLWHHSSPAGTIPAWPGAKPQLRTGPVLQLVPVPAAPVTVTQTLFNDFNRAC